MTGIIHTHSVIPSQRAPVPFRSVLANKIIDTTGATGPPALDFKGPKTGTAWQLQGASVYVGGSGAAGAGGLTVDLVLRKSGRTVLVLGTFSGGTNPVVPWAEVMSKQLTQPVPIFDTDNLSLELVLGDTTTNANLTIVRAELQTIYL